MEPLNILISNDDGVFAEGIRALAKSAQKRGHKVNGSLSRPRKIGYWSWTYFAISTKSGKSRRII